MNTHLRRSFYLFVAGFVGLVLMLAYWQVYSREALANNPENGFQTQRSISSPRGLILAGDGETVLAKSIKRPTPRGPVYDRVYPLGEPFANVVGYWSTRYGATGIEIGNNSDLSSIAGEPETLDDLINRATGGPQPGNNVVLTIDPELQELAYQELSASSTGRGSVVALNPQTGEILAMATSPSFDPNNIDENYPDLANDEDAPLVDRATQSLYPPGSVFKVITAAAALEAGVSPQQHFFDSGVYQLPGYTVHNFEGKEYGDVTFTRALAFSINVIFAKIGGDRQRRQAHGAPHRARGPLSRRHHPRQTNPERPPAGAPCEYGRHLERDDAAGHYPGGTYRGRDRRHEGGREDGDCRVGQRAPAFVVDHLRPRRRPEDRHVRDDRERRQV